MFQLYVKHRLTCHVDIPGLNYETEWSETNANRHVQLIEAMLTDGM